MGILEILVIATILIAAVYVGYHVWQDSLNSPTLEHESIDLKTYSFQDIVIPSRTNTYFD